MEKLLEQAQKLVKDLQIELSEAKQKNAEANRISAEARIIKGKIEEIKADLDGREAAIAQGEGPIKAAHEARRIQQENAVSSAKLHDDKAAIEAERADLRIQFAKLRTENLKNKQEIDSTRENFQEAAAALKKEKDAFAQKLKDLGVK